MFGSDESESEPEESEHSRFEDEDEDEDDEDEADDSDEIGRWACLWLLRAFFDFRLRFPLGLFVRGSSSELLSVVLVPRPFCDFFLGRFLSWEGTSSSVLLSCLRRLSRECLFFRFLCLLFEEDFWDVDGTGSRSLFIVVSG